MLDAIVEYQTLARACAEGDRLDLLHGVVVEEQVRRGNKLCWSSVRLRVCAYACGSTLSAHPLSVCMYVSMRVSSHESTPSVLCICV